MEPVDIGALEKAVTVFYQSGSTEQAVAHDWLTQMQCSPIAWSFVWDLMQPGKPSEVQFFGATTLHAKLMKYWHEVPAQNRNELKEKLLQAIITFGGGPQIVLNRLCISFSAFIVHMLTEWPTAVQDVVNIFQTQQLRNVTRNTQDWIMMEILCAIPEENDAIFTSVQRAAIRNVINQQTTFILNIVDQYIRSKCEMDTLQDSDMGTLLRASVCASAWLKNGCVPLDHCQYLATTLLKLINKCYWPNAQNDGCLSAEENELCESALKTLSTMMNQPDSHRYSTSALNLMKMFLDSLTDITKAEWKENNQNEDVVVGIYTLLISSIECHSRLLMSGVLAESIEHRDLYVRLIEQILQCTDKPGIYPVEENCSTLSMGFWYMLQDEVLSNPDSVVQCRSLEIIAPVYIHLTKILVRKAQQPDDASIDKWTADDLEAFRCYRQDISDTLLYCYDVLHENLLHILSEQLNEAIIAFQQDTTSWTNLESCIFSYYSVAEHVLYDENKYLPRLMQVLTEIPYEQVRDNLFGTSLETIGAYSGWLHYNPQFLLPCIELLVKGLSSPMASVSTLSLKDLCRECQLELAPYSEPLLQACQQSLLSGTLKNSESVRLMFSVGKVMSTLPVDKIPPFLDLMVAPCFEELQQLTQSRSTTEPSKIRTIFRLNMISTLFSSLNTNTERSKNPSQPITDQTIADPSSSAIPTESIQPVLLVIQRTMPIFKTIGEIWIERIEVIEVLCAALKHAITNLLNDVKPILPDLCHLTLSILQTKCVPPAVEIARTCIIIFYKDDQCQTIMQQLLSEVVLYNFRVFEQTPETKYSDIVDLIESFYTFSGQIVRKVPSAFSDANVDCSKLLQFALKSMTRPEYSAVKTVVQFIAQFTMQSRNSPQMTAAILERGGELIRTTILCIAIHISRQQTEIFADIFIAINKKYPMELIGWLKILELQQFPTALVSDKDKESFMKRIIKEKVNKRLLQGHIRTFAGCCRGIYEK